MSPAAPTAPASQDPFHEASAIRALSKGHYRWDAPDGWQQGRGAFGGLVLGALTRAMDDFALEASADARTLRTLTGELCAPALPGAFDVHVEALRIGKSMSFLDARLLRDGEVVARASTTYAASRGLHTPEVSVTAPRVAPYASVPVVPIAPPLGPVFARAYEYRSSGPRPFEAGPEAVTRGWICERLPAQRRDAPAMIGLLDAWWPTIFSIDTRPRAIATVSFTAELMVDPRTLLGAEPLMYSGRAVAARDGQFVELRELWSEGRLVALNQQTFVILG